MQLPRSKSAASMLNEYFFVTGGLGLDKVHNLASTEMFLNGQWTCGPQLPLVLSMHCQIEFRNTTIVVGKRRKPNLNMMDFW